MSQRIARMGSNELLANADEVIEAATVKLKALCQGERWRMSVPVQDDDSDIALGAVIRLAARQKREIEHLTAIIAPSTHPTPVLEETQGTGRADA